MAITRTNLRMTDTAVITPLDRGATGDNVADDTAFIQAAIDDTSYSIVDLQGKTYRITSTLTCNHSDKEIRNGTLRYDGVEDTDRFMLSVVGAVDSISYPLTADTFVGDNYIDISSENLTASGIVAGDWVLVRSDSNITNFGSDFKPEDMLKVWYTTTTRVYFTESLSFKYRTSETAVITKVLTIRDNIKFNNLTFKGKGVTRKDLGSNPLTPQSTGESPVTIRVAHTSHGQSVGGKVSLANCVTGSGVDAESISSRMYAITNIVDVDNYDISVADTGGADSTSAFGGSTMVAYNGNSMGLQILYAANMIIRNCTFEDIALTNLEMQFVHNALVTENRVGNSTLGQPWNSIGIYSVGGRHLTVSDNIITGRSVGVRVGNITGAVFATVANNTIESCNTQGVSIYPTTLKCIVSDNIIRMTDWQPKNFKFSSIGIQAFNNDLECTGNKIEGATSSGIAWYMTAKGASGFGGGLSLNSDLTGEYPSAGYCNISNNTIHAPRSTAYVALDTNRAEHCGILIREQSSGTTNATCEGCRITNNFIFGYPCSIQMNVKDTKTSSSGSVGWKDIVISNNIGVSTPKAGHSTSAYGLSLENEMHATNEGLLSRCVFSGNVFDARGTNSDAVDDQSLIDFYDGVHSHGFYVNRSAITSNCLSLGGTTSKPLIRFSASSSDNIRYPRGCTLMGNTFNSAGEAQSAVSAILVYDSGLSTIVGRPTSSHGADTGTFYGLNAFTNINESGWLGTP